jgi:hypothetical protein
MITPETGEQQSDWGALVSMSAMSIRSRPGRAAAPALVLLAFAAAAMLVALAGCSSSKPAYCTDRTNLQSSVNGLTSSISSRDISGVKSQVDKIQGDATTVVNSAKGDFPTETSAITSSVDALKGSLGALSSSSSAAEMATVAKDGASVVSSVKSFVDASNSKCS